jgi:hypothetical protein
MSPLDQEAPGARDGLFQVSPLQPPDWRDPDAYAALALQDRRALALEWLLRSPDFDPAALHSAATGYLLRVDPMLLVLDEAADSRLRPWGLHFRPALRQPPWRGSRPLAG